MIRSRHLLSLCVLLALATLSGCSVRQTVRAAQRPTKLTLLPDIAPDANAGAPVAVDILTITDQQIVNQLLTVSAQGWFQMRPAFLAQHAGQLHLYSYQWAPGQVQAPIVVDNTARAAGVLLFANYSSPGAHRTVLPLAAVVRLQLQASDFQVQILP